MLRVFYGGTFDPVHNGHLAIARAARDALSTMVRLLPAADPPHRAAPGATSEQRAAMLDLAVQGQGGLRVDRRELARTTPSWTIDTLRELRAEFGETAPLAFVVGADSLHGLPTWREPQALVAGAHWIVAERPGSDLDVHLPPDATRLMAWRGTRYPEDLRASPGGRVLRLRHPLQPESAIDIRRRIADAETWHHLVPPAVGRYIAEHGLYGAVPVTIRPPQAPRV